MLLDEAELKYFDLNTDPVPYRKKSHGNTIPPEYHMKCSLIVYIFSHKPSFQEPLMNMVLIRLKSSFSNQYINSFLNKKIIANNIILFKELVF